MHRHRKARSLAGPENDAADQQRREADGAHHWKLRQRPHHGQREQHPTGIDSIDDEADHYGRCREQEEKRRAQQPELFRLKLQLRHDRYAGKADHDLVGEIDQHEKKQQKSDSPGAFGRRLRIHEVPPAHVCRRVAALGCYLSGLRQCNPILTDPIAADGRSTAPNLSLRGSRSRRETIEPVISRPCLAMLRFNGGQFMRSLSRPGMLGVLVSLSMLAGSAALAQSGAMPDYEAIVASPDRSDADRQTDQRRQPAKMLAFTGAATGMKVLDMEANAGYSTELLARAVGPSGVVYAQDSAGIIERFVKDKFDLRAQKPAMK